MTFGRMSTCRLEEVASTMAVISENVRKFNRKRQKCRFPDGEPQSGKPRSGISTSEKRRSRRVKTGSGAGTAFPNAPTATNVV